MDTHNYPQGQSYALPFNEEAAFNKLASQHRALLVGLAKKHCQSPLTLDECLGEAKVGLWKAYRQHGSNLLDDANAARLIFTCVNSHLIDLKRSFFQFERLKARRIEHHASYGTRHISVELAEQRFAADVCDGLGLDGRETPGFDASPCTYTLRAEALALLDQQVSMLKPAQQAIIHARYYQGRTLAEVASNLGVTASAVHAAETRALQSMRNSLDPSLLDAFRN